jgi:phenylacetate-CoA ligase
VSRYAALLESVILPAGDRLLGTRVVMGLRDWRRCQWLPGAELERMQAERLDRLLRHASTHSPHYRDLAVRECRDPYRWLRCFPVLTKRDLAEQGKRLIAGTHTRLIAESSSGSSGVQSTVYTTRLEESATRAIQLLWWEWAGYRLGDPILQTGMTLRRGPIKTLKDALLRTDYQPAFYLDESSLTRMVERLARRPRTMLLGYASSLYLIARAAQALGRSDIRLRGIVSWGDKLFDHYRAALEDCFGVPVHDTYACTEGCMIAGQCERLRYHVTTPQVYLELLDPTLTHEVADGEIGHVVVTRLDAYAMPLIRYSLGDLAVREPSHAACECGRTLPLLRRVIGRDTDIVRTASGKHLIVHFFTAIFEHVPEIRQFRVVQRSLTGMEIEYIPAPGFRPEVLEGVRARIHAHLGEAFPVEFRPVAHIPATASGKPQIVQSLVAAAR